jgi:DNA anti-recombination protein RmuC
MSILLSLFFRIYTIIIEGSFNKFCQEVERKLRYTAPQSITAEMNERMAEQVSELKQINSAEFFARMGEAVSPRIQTAFSTAIAPVTNSIDEAVKQLANNSQEGISELITRFIEGVQGGAGTELHELASTLKSMQAALLDTHRGIQGTGEDFGRRMSEAAENLNRLVSEAGEKLRDSSENSRTVLLDVVAAVRETFEQASRKVDQGLGQAVSGASGQVEEAMGRVLSRLEGQVDSFRSGLGGFQEAMAGQIDETRKTVASAQVAATNAIAGASAEAAKALQSGISEVVSQIKAEFERFMTVMQSTGAALDAQAKSIREASTQSGIMANAFSQTAQDVRDAAGPLTKSGERIAGATERMTVLMDRSVVGLESGQQAARQLAEALLGHASQLSRTWESYSAKFERVDADLARAVTELGQATERQAQMLTDYASKVDEGFAKAVTNLNPLLNELSENTQCFGEAVEDLCGALRSRRAGEARAQI